MDIKVLIAFGQLLLASKRDVSSKHHRAGHVICGLYGELGRSSDKLSSLVEAAMIMKQKVGY